MAGHLWGLEVVAGACFGVCLSLISLRAVRNCDVAKPAFCVAGTLRAWVSSASLRINESKLLTKFVSNRGGDLHVGLWVGDVASEL